MENLNAKEAAAALSLWARGSQDHHRRRQRSAIQPPASAAKQWCWLAPNSIMTRDDTTVPRLLPGIRTQAHHMLLKAGHHAAMQPANIGTTPGKARCREIIFRLPHEGTHTTVFCPRVCFIQLLGNLELARRSTCLKLVSEMAAGLGTRPIQVPRRLFGRKRQ